MIRQGVIERAKCVENLGKIKEKHREESQGHEATKKITNLRDTTASLEPHTNMITSLPKTLSRASWKSYVSPQSRFQPLKSVVRLHQPKSYEEVINDPTHSRLWREAIDDELDSLAMYHTIRIFTGFRNQPHQNLCTYHNNKHHGPRIRFNSYLLTFGAGKNVARRLNYKRPEDLFVKRSSEKSHH